MTKAVRFTRAEIENAARVSREQLVIVKLTRTGDLLVFPDLKNAPKLDMTEEDFLDAQLAAFEAENGDR